MSWTFVVLALVLFIFAIYIGFLCGQWACEKRVITKRDYWIANFAGAAAVVLLTWAAADAGDAEERRRARHNGAADRQLISVTDDSKGAGKHAKK